MDRSPAPAALNAFRPPPLIDLIAGARPNFLKVAPFIHALHRAAIQSATLEDFARFRRPTPCGHTTPGARPARRGLRYLRDNTKRPETLPHGTNELIGTNPASLQPALDRLLAGHWKRGSIPFRKSAFANRQPAIGNPKALSPAARGANTKN